VLIVRPGEALFFANVERILGAALRLVRQCDVPVHTVILSLEETPDLDGTSIEALQAFFLHVHLEGKRLILARLKHAAMNVLAQLPEVTANGVILSGLSVDGAVQQALRLDSEQGHTEKNRAWPGFVCQRRSSHTVCALQNSRTPKCDSSRPKPLFFTPPKVTRGSLAE
jgi:MFS superfamily sulfate permease-like transporter